MNEFTTIDDILQLLDANPWLCGTPEYEEYEDIVNQVLGDDHESGSKSSTS